MLLKRQRFLRFGAQSVVSSSGLFALLVLVCLSPLLFLAACAADSPSPGASVSMLDNLFSPKELHIQAGQTVTWTNNGRVEHMVTADDKSFDSGDIEPGGQFTHLFSHPGSYPYYCSMHGGSGGIGMAGSIIVSSPSSTLPNAFAGNAPTDTPVSQGNLPLATLHVPSDYPTITAAVHAAKPGDLILIAPGIYHEALIVQTPDLTIRGQDRNKVIMEGDFTRQNGFYIVANHVVLENMTARHYHADAFYWDGVDGYRGSYLTAYANGNYGVYAFRSVNGQFDHDYAAGQPDSGFYIGGCYPCHTVITDVLAEDNALGYSGVNAGGDLVIKDSIWRDNVSGIGVATEDAEPLAPQHGVTILHNLVENNNNDAAPSKPVIQPAIGNGIVIAGGNDNIIKENRVSGQAYYGILVIPNIARNFWEPGGNLIENNVVSNSGVADLGLSVLTRGNNCFSGNTVTRTAPPFLQFTHACGSTLAHAGGGDPSAAFYLIDHYMRAQLKHFQVRSWTTYPDPTTLQPGMPNPTIGIQGIFTTGGYTLNMTASTPVIHAQIVLGGLSLATPLGEIILGFYVYLLPIALYATWFGVSTWDLIHRTDLQNGARLAWLAIVYLLPVIGPLAYFLASKSAIQRSTRLSLALGVPLLYIIIVVLLLFIVP